MKKYICYHWSRNDDCLGYDDGRKIILGETLSVRGKPSLCNYGLHGSQSIVDALTYASGSHLWKVEIWGDVQIGDDKICGTHRKTIVEYGDVLPLIVSFAKWCADRAAEYASKSAESASKYAEYASKSAESASKYAAYASKSAEYASKYAAYAAEYAAEYAEHEKQQQEEWWTNNLRQLKGE